MSIFLPQWNSQEDHALRHSQEMLRLAVEAAAGGKLDMGALVKQAMASPAIAPFKKDAPKYAQKLAKAGGPIGSEAWHEM